MRSACWSGSWRVTARAACRQLLLVALINVPTVSFGLALGWVSLASGEAAGDEVGGEVVAAVTTFGASLLGVPASARALTRGRKFAVICTSLTFVACWSLKLVGGAWCVLVARAAAGVGAAGAWALAPLLAREMCSPRWSGAAAAALVPAHNLGLLLMYLAADARLPHGTVLWWCLGLSLAHCVAFLFVPESPAYLAANGQLKEAERALRWLRGEPAGCALRGELAALPAPDPAPAPWLQLAKEMLSDKCRRRAFLVGGFAVVGQEMCGVLALMQYAERVFVLARGDAAAEGPGAPAAGLATPARHALLLGAVQLAASVVALYLVERVGRRPLIVWCGAAAGAWLAAGAALLPSALRVRGVSAAGLALAAAVAADSVGLQPAPYALLADMFHYQYRGCAMLLVTLAACAGNALEAGVFPLVAALAGLRAAVALAAALTLAYAAVVYCVLPETRARSPEQIYAALCPPAPAPAPPSGGKVEGRRECPAAADCEAGPGPGARARSPPSGCKVIYDGGKDLRDVETNVKQDNVSALHCGMGLMDKLSVWLGGGRSEATVLLLGLDNSGKSSLLRALRTGDAAQPQHQDSFTSGGVAFRARDVSGAPRHRALWERHFARADALIFVVDAADHLRLVVAREELQLALAHPELRARRMPLLVLANKSDAPHALPAARVAAALGLERVVDKPWHVCGGSAATGAGLADALGWLARELREAAARRRAR